MVKAVKEMKTLHKIRHLNWLIRCSNYDKLSIDCKTSKDFGHRLSTWDSRKYHFSSSPPRPGSRVLISWSSQLFPSGSSNEANE